MALDLRLDGRVLAVTLDVSVVAGAVGAGGGAAELPAGHLRHASDRGRRQPEQFRWRNTLVVAQLTVSPALLVGAGLVLRSVQQVQSVDPGFGHATAALRPS